MQLNKARIVIFLKINTRYMEEGGGSFNRHEFQLFSPTMKLCDKMSLTMKTFSCSCYELSLSKVDTRLEF